MTAAVLGVWLSIIWIAQAGQGIDPLARGARSLQQACSDPRSDLLIDRIEVNSRGIGQPFDVRVDIVNNSSGTNGLADSWAYLYVDRTPTGAPNVQAFAPTSRLASEQPISARFTVTSGYATVGWHTVSVMIDATDAVPNEGCGGENNNQGATSFEITTVQPTDTPLPTSTTPPTSTPFPPPDIYLFEPTTATIGRGDAVTLRWQVTGESVSVTLDGELVPMEATVDKYPTESHVYTLRAENPGGVVQETSRITVEEPTVTPTPTEAACDYPTVHEFGASPTSVNRGERVTVYWDVEGASEVFLNGEKVSDVSAREFRLNRTTTFSLLARNTCGEVEEELTVQAKYATSTPTYTPTLTRTPTRTSTPTATTRPTYTPTPTRNVLPTHTRTPTGTAARTGTTTPTRTSTSSAFDSPVGTPTGTASTPTGTVGTPTGTVRATASVSATPSVSATGTITASATLTPTSTATPSPTWTVTATSQASSATPSPTSTAVKATSTVDLSGPVENTTSTQTPDVGLGHPTIVPTAVPPLSTMRMYLCPLVVLLLFAVGVVILSIVVPRIQERQQDLDDFGYSTPRYGVASAEISESNLQQQDVYGSDSTLFGVEEPADEQLLDQERLPEDISFAPDEPLLVDEPSQGDGSFAPDGPLHDDEPSPEHGLSDPLLDELAFPDRQEAERASTASEEQT